MRVISKFQDYYDCGMAYGQDDDLVYVRKPENKQLKCLHKWNTEEYATFEKELTRVTERNGLRWNKFIVGFCGKSYIGLRVKVSTFNKKYEHNGQKTYHCYCLEDVQKVFKKYLDKKEFEEFMNPPKKYRWRFRYDRMHLTFFDGAFKLDEEKYRDYFIDNKVPIVKAYLVDNQRDERGRWLGERIVVEHNTCLKDVEFYKVVDPYTAFQELSMFIGGVIGMGEPHTLDISDECMRDAKGFNNQSFKTRKGTKPNRKAK